MFIIFITLVRYRNYYLMRKQDVHFKMCVCACGASENCLIQCINLSQYLDMNLCAILL